jgi:two-component system sensor histidine kinase TctE
MVAGTKTLRNKLLRILLVPLSLLLLADAVGSYLIAARVSDELYDRELVEIVQELALHVADKGGKLVFDMPGEVEHSLLTDSEDKIFFAVYDAGGALVAGEPSLARPGFTPVNKVSFFNGLAQGEPIREVLLRMDGRGGSVSATPVVLVAETRTKRHALTEKIVFGVTVPQLVLILIVGVLVWAGVAQGLAPLQKLQRAVTARSHSDLSPLVAEDVPGEVHPVVAAINDLMARLNEVLDFQGRFIADAAHQLRTPVAGLKAHLEVALRETDFDQAKKAMAHIYISVERLSRLVSQLLSFARNEPSLVKKGDFALVDLNKLVFETTMEWVPDAYKRDIDLGFEGVDGQLMINGDTVRLRELINNLIDNAIRYSRSKGRVTVRVAEEEGAQLSVSDDGPVIPGEERQRVFERFHRLLGSHTEGSGLGLAIVREIATSHDATISLVDDADGIGNKFIVSFPDLPAA